MNNNMDTGLILSNWKEAKKRELKGLIERIYEEHDNPQSFVEGLASHLVDEGYVDCKDAPK